MDLDAQKWQVLAKADGTQDLGTVLRKLATDRSTNAERREGILRSLAALSAPEDFPVFLRKENFLKNGDYDAVMHAHVLEALARAAGERAVKAPAGAEALLRPWLEGTGASAMVPVRAGALRLAGLWKMNGLLPMLVQAA